MHRLARVLHRRVAHHLAHAGLAVHLDVADVRRERRTRHRRIHRRAPDDRAAGLRELGGNLGHRQRRPLVGRCHRHHTPMLPARLVHRDAPDLCRAATQLLAHVARRIDHRHAGRVADAAAGGDLGEAGRVGVGHTRPHTLHRNAQFLGHHHRLRGARAADVRVAGDHRGAAVAAEHHRRAGAHAGVEPEAAGEAAPDARGDRSLPVLTGLHPFEHGAEADGTVRRTVGREVPLRDGIREPDLDRIETERGGDLVDGRFDGERRHRRSRCAVRRHLRLVDDDVVGVDVEVGDVVGREHAHRTGARGRAAIGTRLVIERCGRRHDRAVLLRTELHADLRRRRRAGGAEHLVAGHHHLHRPLRLTRQHHCERLEVDRNLAAEAAADLARCHLDVCGIEAEHRRRGVAHKEGALRARPDVDAAVLVHTRHAGMRLDVALMAGRRAEHALHDDISRSEAGCEVAALQFEASGDVRRPARLDRRAGLRHEIVVQDRRARFQGPVNAEHRLEHLVVDTHQLRGGARRRQRGGRHCCHSMAVIERLGARQQVVGHVLQVHRAFAHPELDVDERDVLSGDDGLDAWHRQGSRRIDAPDASVCVRAAHDDAVEHARQREVGAIIRAAGHLVDAVMPDRPGADGRENLLAHARVLLMFAAASSTARTILS